MIAWDGRGAGAKMGNMSQVEGRNHKPKARPQGNKGKEVSASPLFSNGTGSGIIRRSIHVLGTPKVERR